MLSGLFTRSNAFCVVVRLRPTLAKSLLYGEPHQQRRAVCGHSHMDKFLVKKRPAADVVTEAIGKGEAKKVKSSDR